MTKKIILTILLIMLLIGSLKFPSSFALENPSKLNQKVLDKVILVYSNEALSDQESKQNNWMLFWTALIAVTSIIAGIASIIASISSWKSANTANISAIQAENTAKAQLRPYVLLELASNLSEWDGEPKVVLPINLRNIGQTPASKILKGYNSFLQDKVGSRILVHPYREQPGEEDSLAPTQTSATHMLDINITGFDLDKYSAIKVEVLISYEGFHEIDSKRYLSKANYIMTPVKATFCKCVFEVSQPKLAFGYTDDGWDANIS